MMQDFKDVFELMLGMINVEVIGGRALLKFKIYFNDYDDVGMGNEFMFKLDKEFVL